MAPDYEPDAPQPSTLPKTPITIRLGDLEPEVAHRRRGRESAANVIRRDLTRYYAVVRESLRRLRLSGLDAEMLSCALRDTQLDERSIRFLWAEVEQQLDAMTQGEPQRWSEHWTPDARVRLVARLKGISPGDAMAIRDAVEVYWDYFHGEDFDWRQAMALSRLTTDIPAPDALNPDENKPNC